jgi:hypothetical protein
VCCFALKLISSESVLLLFSLWPDRPLAGRRLTALVGNAANIPAGFLWATMESVLVKRNVDTLRIRRIFNFLGAALYVSITRDLFTGRIPFNLQI